MSAPLDPRQVADYLLAYTDAEAGDTISNLKLQKLVYYAQGFCLAMRRESLFNAPIEAWVHGPVVRRVYFAHHHRGARAIDPPADFDPEGFSPEDRELLDAILATYGQLSAAQLRNMTHEESPWREAYVPDENVVITPDSMLPFFSYLVDAGRKGESIPGRPRWNPECFQHQRRRDLDARMVNIRQQLRKKIHARGGPGAMWSDDED